MATTYIKPYKVSSGLSAVQTMKERFEYGLDPKKCAAVCSYLCEPETAHAEFMSAPIKLSPVSRKAEPGAVSEKD